MLHVACCISVPVWAGRYFAKHLQQAGYTVGVFGKHLNSGNPACPPAGVDRWLVNDGGDYFAPQFACAALAVYAARAGRLI
jgi:flavin-dependent dehydrogenase